MISCCIKTYFKGNTTERLRGGAKQIEDLSAFLSSNNIFDVASSSPKAFSAHEGQFKTCLELIKK
jgi:hypothetical protein